MRRWPLSDVTLAPQSAAEPAEKEASDKVSLGSMPEWDLSDLYAGPDDPEIQRDLKAAAAEATRIKATYQGRLAALAKEGGKLVDAIKDYEKLSDLAGKLGSYSGLYYVLNQTDPVRAKFNADVSEALTKLYTDLIFFELELNQIDDAVIEAALTHESLKRYKPWFEDLRKEKPHQLDEKIETLFTEKSQTSRGAWNRLFDETMSALRFDVKGVKEPLSLEPTLNFLSDADDKKRKAGSEALAKVFKANLPLFTRITNTLAKDKEISDRWHNFKDVADSRNLANRVEGPVVDALVSSVRTAYPLLSHRYYAMKAKWLGKKKLASWDRNAPLPDKPERTITWTEAEQIVLRAYNGFAPEMATIAKQFFDKNWIDAPVKAWEGARRILGFDGAFGPSVRDDELPREAARCDDARARARARRASMAGAGPGTASGADTVDARRNRVGFRRNADVQGTDRRDEGCAREESHARLQGRGHDQHRCPADCVLQLRAKGARGAAPGRANVRPDQ